MAAPTHPSTPGDPNSTHEALVTTPASASYPQWNETLRDGTPVLIRPMRHEDAALERAFIERLSPESRRMRFLGAIKEPTDEMIRRFTDIDYDHDAAFIAIADVNGAPCEIGVSRFSLSPNGESCECAVTVADDWHHRGLGTSLMKHLIDVARARGVRTMFSIDSAENASMRELAHYLGFTREADPDDPAEVVHTLKL